MRRRLLAAVAVLAVALAGCTGLPALVRSTASVIPTPTRTPTPTPSVDPIAGLTLQQEVGQLFVVGTPTAGLDGDTASAIRDRHVGGIFLHGRSQGGAPATLALVQQAKAASTDGISLIVATDQEGGQVQVLQGPGFDAIPSAVVQGTMPPDQLRAMARVWGSQLRAAGVNLDLAPVADIVPAGTEQQNPPIGALQREYGGDAATVEPHAAAFAAGMRDAGVQSTAKHFPGLGHVAGNTDDTAGVTDSTVAADSPDVTLYRQLMTSGLDGVMVSSAIYVRIDPTQPAVFSPAVVGILRDQLHFDGVIITDDVSEAAQVLDVSPEDRALRAIDAGIDLVLISNVPALAPQMVDAVVARAQADAAFRAKVDAAARTVLTWKRTHLAPG